MTSAEQRVFDMHKDEIANLKVKGLESYKQAHDQMIKNTMSGRTTDSPFAVEGPDYKVKFETSSRMREVPKEDFISSFQQTQKMAEVTLFRNRAASGIFSADGKPKKLADRTRITDREREIAIHKPFEAKYTEYISNNMNKLHSKKSNRSESSIF